MAQLMTWTKKLTLAESALSERSERHVGGAERQALRQALLLGTHPRCGCRSLVRMLPREALELILCVCAPPYAHVSVI